MIIRVRTRSKQYQIQFQQDDITLLGIQEKISEESGVKVNEQILSFDKDLLVNKKYREIDETSIFENGILIYLKKKDIGNIVKIDRCMFNIKTMQAFSEFVSKVHQYDETCRKIGILFGTRKENTMNIMYIYQPDQYECENIMSTTKYVQFDYVKVLQIIELFREVNVDFIGFIINAQINDEQNYTVSLITFLKSCINLDIKDTFICVMCIKNKLLDKQSLNFVNFYIHRGVINNFRNEKYFLYQDCLYNESRKVEYGWCIHHINNNVYYENKELKYEFKYINRNTIDQNDINVYFQKIKDDIKYIFDFNFLLYVKENMNESTFNTYAIMFKSMFLKMTN